MQEPEAFAYCWHRNNGEFYYGIHKGSLEDNYAGSGTIFASKFGGRRKSDCKEPTEWNRTIEFRGTYEECVEWEVETVNETLIAQPDCLNVKLGGIGGCGKHSEETKKKIGLAHKGVSRPSWASENKEKMSEIMKAKGYKPPSQEGNKFTESHKANLSISNQKLGAQPNAKPIEIDGKLYTSIRQAARELGCSRNTIKQWKH